MKITRRSKIAASKEAANSKVGKRNVCIKSSYDSEYESEWTELRSKSVLDSDGFYTDYTLYTNGSTFICMFGDKDIYEPDEMYADYETDDEEAAYSWFDNYEGFSDEDDEFFDVSSAANITASDNTDDLWEVIDDEAFEFSGVQDVGYDDDDNIMVIFNHAISEDMIEPTAEELLIAFRQYGYPVHEWNTNGDNVFILSRGGILGSTIVNNDPSLDLEANHNRILGSKSFGEPYDPYLLDELINYYSMQDTMNLSDIWDEIVDRYGDEALANDVIESIDDSDDIYSSCDVYSSAANLEYEDDIQEIGQEFTSENTSINSGKLPAIFKMIHLEPGTINIDYGGGRFDNVSEYLTQYDVINLVYDPYNRSKEHNQEVIRTVKAAGGADTATCSNVLNVIKEPEVRQNVLQNIRKLVKPNGNIYITVYEGSGKGNEGPTKSGYQLNRKTADYLEEIQQVFPDAVRKGKLIVATNSDTISVNSSTDAGSSASYGGAFDIEDNQHFTKDEIVEFGNTVCDHLNETFYDTYYVSDVYMENPKKLVLTVVQASDKAEFTATVDIDIRKIRKPTDLMNRYLGDVVYALQHDIGTYNDESSGMNI